MKTPQIFAELINFIYECELHMFCLLYVNSNNYV